MLTFDQFVSGMQREKLMFTPMAMKLGNLVNRNAPVKPELQNAIRDLLQEAKKNDDLMKRQNQIVLQIAVAVAMNLPQQA